MSQTPCWDAIQSHPLDNVATLLRPITIGHALTIQTTEDTVKAIANNDIPRCHKMALRPIAQHEPIVKYGATIGTATQSIATGDWVHVHNLISTRA